MANLRDTSQRRAILEELLKLKTHPTANELYEIVRLRIPKISLGTVYRNLELLAETGVIQKLDTAGAQKRFDGMLGEHYHVRCVKCGRVDDLDLPFLNSLNKSAALSGNYEIISHHLEFEGICPECRSQSMDRGNDRDN
ncbi:MAG: transcriptional repressor [Pseudomonadota bacterium]